MHLDLRNVVLTVWKRRHWILVSTLVMTFLALCYALLKQDVWTSTQSLYVRNESVGQVIPLGRFESVDSMQTAQETIFELVQQPSVLRESLLAVGPAKKIWSRRKREAWPSAEFVDEFRRCVQISAPRGAPLGRTEMIYLTVKAKSPVRANQLVAEITDNLIRQARTLRQKKYEAVIDELCSSAAIAQTELEKAIRKLSALDQKLGSDVVEMRVINNDSQGEGILRRSLSEIRAEVRTAKSDYARKQLARQQLLAVRDDPNKLIALPNELLQGQPGLIRLKEGLVDAQVNTARLSGEMSTEHPRVQAAMLAERKIHQRLFAELQTAIDVSETELQLAASRMNELTEHVQTYENRFADLSEARTQYNRLTKEVEFKQGLLEKVENDLAMARANLATTSAASLIQRVDAPIPSTRPIGPSRKSILASGVLGGALLGLGLIWLAEPVRVVVDRRCAAIRGRRAADRLIVRQVRVLDATNPSQLETTGRRLEDQLLVVPRPDGKALT